MADAIWVNAATPVVHNCLCFSCHQSPPRSGTDSSLCSEVFDNFLPRSGTLSLAPSFKAGGLTASYVSVALATTEQILVQRTLQSSRNRLRCNFAAVYPALKDRIGIGRSL